MLSICAKSESEDHFSQLIFEEVNKLDTETTTVSADKLVRITASSVHNTPQIHNFQSRLKCGRMDFQ